MKVAVVGGGLFGCAIAIDLARAGATVELFEARSDIMEGASARNQARLHSGYHYPRSDATAITAREASKDFRRRWADAVWQARHWYIVAPESRVSASDYVAFLERVGLPYEIADDRTRRARVPQVHTAELVVRAYESFIDVDMLSRLLRRELAASDVTVHTSRNIDTDEVPGFSVTVWATYGAHSNRVLRYEICEVALIELGAYSGDSFVIIDGEFVSLDPRGRVFTLYDVNHSVHHVHEGVEPDIPADYAPLLKRTLVRPGSPGADLTHFPHMVASASRYLRGLQPHGQHVAIYHGSMYSLRAVLPDVDGTDARPTFIKRVGNVVHVLAGKMCTAATVGSAVVDEVLQVPA